MATKSKATDKDQPDRHNPEWGRWRYAAWAPVAVVLYYLPWEEIGFTFTVRR